MTAASSLSHKTLADDEVTVNLARRILTEEHAVVTWDTETSGLSPYAGDYITGLSLCLVHYDYDNGDWWREDGVYVPIGHKRGNVDPAAVRMLLDAMDKTEAAHGLHHATFDWAFVKQLGVDLSRHAAVDTQVVRWLQDENQPKALKVLGAMLLGEDADKEQRELKQAMRSPWKNQTEAYKAVREAYPEIPVAEARAMARRMRKDRDWGDLTADEIAPYAAHDAELTADVGNELIGYEVFTDPGVLRGLEREMALQPILFDMTHRGVSADHHQLQQARVQYELAAAKIRAELTDGFYAHSPWAGNGEDFNPGSAKQVAWLLYDHLNLPVLSRTEGGEPQTDKNTLERLQGHEVAAAVLEYRHWVKAAGSYCSPFIDYIERSPDGRVHGMYDSTRTVTGRLSASNPNVMTIPRKDSLPEVRKAFYKTPPGITRYGFDIASAELWVMLHFTKDPVLEEVLLEGRSLHIETMKSLFNTEDKSSRFYTLSKNINYGIPYGAGVDQIAIYAAKVGYSWADAIEVARGAYAKHKQLYKRQHHVSDKLANLARERGKLPMISPGRYRHFKSPGTSVPFYTALNALVQGGVAEFMKDTKLEVYARGYGELLVLQVHDELVFDAPDGMGPELLQLLTDISNDINPFMYPLQWDGKAWSEE